MTERMAIELTVYLDVPADVTEDDMDRLAEAMRQTVSIETDCDVALLRPPFLIDYPQSGDAA